MLEKRDLLIEELELKLQVQVKDTQYWKQEFEKLSVPSKLLA
ncbi:MAG: hypothetical protein NZ767_03575 [SAR86 cluster bacterium]|nr:hypothetical protein [SAR86 cluster bacterium]